MTGLGRKSVGQLVGTGWAIFTRHWLQLTLLSALTVLPFTVPAFVVGREFMPLDPTGQGAVAVVVAITAVELCLGLATLFSMATLHYAVADAVLGRPVEWKDSLRRTIPRLKVIVATFAIPAGVIVGIGAYLAQRVGVFTWLRDPAVEIQVSSADGWMIFGGIVVAVVAGLFMTIALPVAVREDLGVADTLTRTWALMRGSWWRLLGTIVLVGIITSIASKVFENTVGQMLLEGVSSTDGVLVWLIVLTAVPAVFLNPLTVAVLTCAYFDMRVRNGEDDMDDASSPAIGGPLSGGVVTGPATPFTVLPMPAVSRDGDDPPPVLRPRWSEPLGGE